MTKMTVPFFRPSIFDAEIDAVTQCLKSGWLTTGPVTRAFEDSFAARISEDAIALAVNSATAALHLGLEALGVGPGDEVIVPTLTFTSTAEVVRYLEATPKFVDMDPATLCLSIDDVEAAITPKTKVIMPVHFAGRPCDMQRLRTLADTHGLAILDDAAHAFPASHQNHPIGASLADVTAFSFYANKTMTTGEGGMLVTSNQEIADRVRTMRLHGIDRDVFNRFTDKKASWVYDVIAPGYKYNMTDIAAAMGEAQLARTTQFHQSRIRLAASYDTAFADLPLILPPQPAIGDVHSWHLYIVQLSPDSPLDRDRFAQKLQEVGIGISMHYRPLHQMTYWQQYTDGQSFPHAELYSTRCLSLPLFMDMSDEEQDYVIANVRDLLSGSAKT